MTASSVHNRGRGAAADGSWLRIEFLADVGAGPDASSRHQSSKPSDFRSQPLPNSSEASVFPKRLEARSRQRRSLNGWPNWLKYLEKMKMG